MSVVKVAYIIDTIESETAGTQKQLLEIIRQLNRNEFEPFLICLKGSAWLSNNSVQCPTFILHYRGFLKPSFPGILRTFAQLLDDNEIDLVHAFFPESVLVTFIGHWLTTKRPVLISSRRDIGLGKDNQPWYHRVFRGLSPLVNRRYSGIVANSYAIRDYVAKTEKTPDDKFCVIYNGVDIPEDCRLESLTAAHSSAETVVIGIVASLTPVKRHDVLLDALAILKRKPNIPKVTLMIIGDGPTRPAIDDAIRRLHLSADVRICGAVTDVPKRLEQIDIGILCSDREGLSNAILEYMAAGLPTIATEVGGNPELVSADTGQLIPPGDPHALASALEQLAKKPGLRRDLGKNARQIAKTNFSWSTSMLLLEEYYQSFINEPHSDQQNEKSDD